MVAPHAEEGKVKRRRGPSLGPRAGDAGGDPRDEKPTSTLDLGLLGQTPQAGVLST